MFAAMLDMLRYSSVIIVQPAELQLFLDIRVGSPDLGKFRSRSRDCQINFEEMVVRHLFDF